ncbi:hypothetical protein EDF56_106323 [Novosphingobium sp. PhB165]|uniref:hypothetical protein n=1 Tax=Novosphingobium sp. PhB165 TaxID=2485105 RepID=UPI001049AF18|nr:hypothetical protein [Novosphingobium sp. PhB165]TCM17207.1 hypothetical protein EDF56_106323 [Novosphingobium sp. PhB165]
MVAPVDSKADLTVGDETFVLRLNFRTLSLLEKAGLDPFSPDGIVFTVSKMAMMCIALSIDDHPDMTDQEGLAIVVRNGPGFRDAYRELMTNFGGAPDGDEDLGNGQTTKIRSGAPASTTSSSRGSKPASRRKPSGAKRRATTS